MRDVNFSYAQRPVTKVLSNMSLKVSPVSLGGDRYMLSFYRSNRGSMLHSSAPLGVAKARSCRFLNDSTIP
jgi:hypothetical protein